MLLRIAFLLFWFWPLHTHAEWYYVDLLTDKPAELVLRSDSVASHSSESAVTCPAKSAYFCIRSKTFAFAVPKKLAGERLWTLDDASYRVAAERKLFILGKEDNVVLIEQVKEDGAGPKVSLFNAARTDRNMAPESREAIVLHIAKRVRVWSTKNM